MTGAARPDALMLPGRHEVSTSGFHAFMAGEFQILRDYLGDHEFRLVSNSLLESSRKQDLSERQLSEQLPDFLLKYCENTRRREAAELAGLELAFAKAFSARAVAAFTLNDLRRLGPVDLLRTPLEFHPSVQRMAFRHNTVSIWSALKCAEQPPRPHLLDKPQAVVVWRQGHAPRFRILGNEEAHAMDALAATKKFSSVRSVLKKSNGPEAAAACAEAYLRGWVEAELLLPPK